MKKLLIAAMSLLSVSAFASTFTLNYALEKPSDGDTNWGAILRTDLDAIDAQMKVQENGLSNHLLDALDAHDSTAISASTGLICTIATNVQEYLDCLDAQIDALVPGGGVVTISGPQLITGAKTFSNTFTLSGLSTGIVHSSVGGVLSSSNVVNADVDGAAAIDRSKLASGSVNHVVINNGSGVMSSEAFLSASRGGTGVDLSAATGTVKALAGVISASSIVNADIDAAAAISRSKLATNGPNTIVVNDGTGAISSATLTNGQVLLGSTGAAPVPALITGTANQITVTPGAGTLTLATPQNIHTAATPTFATLTASSYLSSPSVFGPIGFRSIRPQEFLLAANADWGLNSFSAALANDVTHTSIQVSGMDSATDECIGFFQYIPAGATSFDITMIGKAAAIPGGVVAASWQMYGRTMQSNLVMGAWSSAFSLPNQSISADLFIKYNTVNVTLASLGLTADRMAQLEICRDANNAADTLVGDYNMMLVNMNMKP